MKLTETIKIDGFVTLKHPSPHYIVQTLARTRRWPRGADEDRIVEPENEEAPPRPLPPRDSEEEDEADRWSALRDAGNDA